MKKVIFAHIWHNLFHKLITDIFPLACSACFSFKTHLLYRQIHNDKLLLVGYTYEIMIYHVLLYTFLSTNGRYSTELLEKVKEMAEGIEVEDAPVFKTRDEIVKKQQVNLYTHSTSVHMFTYGKINRGSCSFFPVSTTGTMTFSVPPSLLLVWSDQDGGTKWFLLLLSTSWACNKSGYISRLQSSIVYNGHDECKHQQSFFIVSMKIVSHSHWNLACLLCFLNCFKKCFFLTS